MFDYREMSDGSFDVLGTGFSYNYNNNKNALTVFHKDTERLLTTLEFDRALSREPLSYVTLLEKASQINALMMSNNQTIDLSQTMELQHMHPLLNSVAEISRHAFDLHNLHLGRFCRAFTNKYDLKCIKIKKFVSGNQENTFFIARMHTKNDNGITVRGCTMTGIMAAMSDRTLRDLITMEFGHRFENSAQNLLNASSKFSSLSYILDENFIPESKLSGTNTNKSENKRIN